MDARRGTVAMVSRSIFRGEIRFSRKFKKFKILNFLNFSVFLDFREIGPKFSVHIVAGVGPDDS